MSEEVYRRLQQRLDTYSVGFPATESGVEIKILTALFSPEDAEMFLGMTPKLETKQPKKDHYTPPINTAEQMITLAQKMGLLP
jgi:electron transport complex protein RnfB